MADSPDTVTEAVEMLHADGYTADFTLEGLAKTCSACGDVHELDHAVIEHQFRFEGPSDPGDEAIVLGVRCPACDVRGVVVSAFGPDADPGLADLLR
jgi:hypothetical protein